MRFPNHFLGVDCPCSLCAEWRKRYPLEYDRIKGSILDPVEAKNLRDKAIDQVDANASETYKTLAYSVISDVAHERSAFTVDTPRDLMVKRFPGIDTHEKRVWGPLMLKAARDGLIVATDRFERGKQKKSHGNPQRFWDSLVYKEASR